MSLTVKDQVNAQYIRLTAPDRPCDRCHKSPPAGETLTIAYIRFPEATVPFSICQSCTEAELDRFKDHKMSHEAARIFMCQQEQGHDKLISELTVLNEWKDRYGAPGQRCDECLQPLVAGEPISTVAVAMTGAVTDRSILHVACPRCASGKTPRIRAACDWLVARIFSTRSTAFLSNLLNPKKAVN